MDIARNVESRLQDDGNVRHGLPLPVELVRLVLVGYTDALDRAAIVRTCRAWRAIASVGGPVEGGACRVRAYAGTCRHRACALLTWQVVIDAMRNGRAHAARWAVESPDGHAGTLGVPSQMVQRMAIRAGQWDLVPLMRQRSGKPSALTVRSAIENGYRYALVQWYRSGHHSDAQLSTALARTGDIEALSWVANRGAPIKYAIATIAAKEGHLDVLRWAIARNKCVDPLIVAREAAMNGQRHIVSWLIDEGIVTSDQRIAALQAICAVALGDLATFDTTIAVAFDPLLWRYLTRVAVLCGRHIVIERALSEGRVVHLIAALSNYRVLRTAPLDTLFMVAEGLVAQHVALPDSLWGLVRRKDFDGTTLSRLRRVGLLWTPRAARYLLMYHKDLLEWAIKDGLMVERDTLMTVVRCMGYAGGADGRCGARWKKTLRVLVDSARCPWTADACTEAARCGLVDVLIEAVTQHNAPWDREACASAVRKGVDAGSLAHWNLLGWIEAYT